MVTNVAALTSTFFVPGMVVTLSYSEDLNCVKPYGFQVQLVLITKSGNTTNTAVLYDAASNNVEAALPLRCLGPLLTLQIPTGIGAKVDLPASVGIRLAGIMDLYLNSDPAETILPLALYAKPANGTTRH
jgi:hypothetical protein